MNTGKTLQIDSGSLADTLALAEKIGRRVKGGETIELVSDLGGGKTAFVSGLAKGMGSRDSVSSPSFTLSNVYQADNISLHHFDFYRLSDPGILRDELTEIISESMSVVVVEWGDIVGDVLPEERLTITIVPTGETRRTLTLAYPATLGYLVG